MTQQKQLYIGLMSGTSMDGVDAVLIQMNGTQWQAALAHTFVPYNEALKNDLLALQNCGENELHRSAILAQTLSRLYAQTVHQLLQQENLSPKAIRALGCHGQTVRHAPDQAYSIQLVDLSLLAELTGIFTIGDFRSRDMAAGGQGAPLVPAFHQAIFGSNEENRVVLNIGGIANISVLNAGCHAFGFDTGAGNMLMDAWTQSVWQCPYDKNGEKAKKGQVLNDLIAKLMSHSYFKQAHPKSTGRELFSLPWLQTHLNGEEQAEDVLRTLLAFTVQSIALAIEQAAPLAKKVYVCGGGVYNTFLIENLREQLKQQNCQLYCTDDLNLNPQWVEAAAFAWLAACWCEGVASNPAEATGARKKVVLGAGYYA